MTSENLLTPFEIAYCETKDCPIVEHRHNFFELVYVIEGSGIQRINENKLPYIEEKLFLLMPQDYHSFEIERTTRFLFIRFNDIYLKTQNKEWLQKLEFIFQANHHLPGCILKNKTDKPLVKSLIEALMREQINQQEHHQEVIRQIVNTLLTIVARNISMAAPLKKSGSINGSMVQDMINYIHQHIYTPELLRTEKMANRFNVSPNYISEYFKKQSGEGLQQYIISCRLKLVETRLQYSDLRINEIAHELQFTDESHLNRTFKKYKGISPSQFRKKIRNEVQVAA